MISKKTISFILILIILIGVGLYLILGLDIKERITPDMDLSGVTSDGNNIEIFWSLNDNVWASGNNTYMANSFDENVTLLSRSAQGERDSLMWSINVLLGDKLVEPINESPSILKIDPYDKNYSNNVLEWNYGICKRHARLMAGVFQELYVFNEDPGADVIINFNSRGSISEVGHYTMDGNQQPLSGYEDNGSRRKISAETFENAVYPIILNDLYIFPSE